MNASKLNKESEKRLERIHKIRKYIKELEYIANGIINVLNSENYLDQSSVKILISNVREYYYNTVMAWEKLNFAVRNKILNLENSKNYLYIAKSR